MLKIFRLGVLVLLLPVLLNIPCVASEYIDNIGEAVSQIELNSYNKAAIATQKALSLNSGDPLAHTALGVIYLHTSKYADAEREFKESLNSREDWQIYYALGMVALAQGQRLKASDYFASARRLSGSEDELIGLDEYYHFVSTSKEPQVGRHEGDTPLARETYAMWAFRNEHYPTSATILSEVLRNPAPLGFTEYRAPLVTFDPAHPIAFPKGVLTWKAPRITGVPSVSGMITLKADTSKTPNVTLVTFAVDGELVGMTNCSPFQFEWNTANHTNGLHSVRIEARSDTEGVVSTKTLKVLISNTEPPKVVPISGDEVDLLRYRLWKCVKLTDSRELAHYYLGKMYLKASDRQSAMNQLQYAIAYDHDLLDARKLLSDARGSRFQYMEIHKGKVGQKRIALTFDDGPNERTEELLQVLHKLHVPATFFVVGFRAEAQPDIIKEMLADGHEIENHTYTHPRLPTLNVEQAEDELAKGSAVVLAMTGKPSLYFRPPGGRSDKGTQIAAARLGLTSIFWTLGCSPYEGARYKQLSEYVINGACDGAIVLMHNGEPATTSALPKIVRTLQAKGYRFVTIDEILSETKQDSQVQALK